MKCVYCGKQEEYTEVKVNVERLLGMVQEAFDSTQDYKMACKKPSWKWTASEEKDYIRHDREHTCHWNAVGDLTQIMGLDQKRLETIARLARKWEQKRKWQYCFPAQGNAKKIMEWLTQPKTNYGSEKLSWIHQRINNKAEKAAKQKAA
jgi:hypothetical protein